MLQMMLKHIGIASPPPWRGRSQPSLERARGVLHIDADRGVNRNALWFGHALIADESNADALRKIVARVWMGDVSDSFLQAHRA